MNIPGISSQLKPHQENAVRKATDLGNILLNHGLGTGKTFTSMAIANAIGNEADVITPASLRQNYLDQIKQHLSEKSVPFNVMSYEGFSKKNITHGR